MCQHPAITEAERFGGNCDICGFCDKDITGDTHIRNGKQVCSECADEYDNQEF